MTIILRTITAITTKAEICRLNASLVDDGLTFCKSMLNHFLKIVLNMKRTLKFEQDMKNCITGRNLGSLTFVDISRDETDFSTVCGQ